MKSQFTYSRHRKRIVGAAIAAYVLAVLSLGLHEISTDGCHLFQNLAWVAFLVLRPAVSALWQSAPLHLCEASSLLQHLLQIVASIRPPLCLMAG